MVENKDNSKDHVLSTSELSAFYSSLPLSSQHYFRRIFRIVFNYLVPRCSITTHGGLLHLYYLMPQIRAKHDLTDSELALLSLIYRITKFGADTTTGDEIKKVASHSFNSNITTLYKRGFISRYYYDPLHPRLSSRRARGGRSGKFIRMSWEGVKLIRQIETDLRNHLYNSTALSIMGK